MYELDPFHFLSAPELVWHVALKDKIKLDLLTDIGMLLMIERGIRGGIWHAIYWYAETNNKYMIEYDKNKESSYLKYWDVNNLYGWWMSQVFPLSGFRWVEETFQFNENFIKSYNDGSDEG